MTSESGSHLSSRPAPDRPHRTAPPHLNQRKANAAPRARDERFAVGVERRHQRRFQQLRRDLLGDALIGCLLAMLALIVAPGLAVIGIASIP
jgi:hypothetical protein